VKFKASLLSITLLIKLCTQNLYGQWIKVWDYRYGGTDQEYLTEIIQTNDHGFLLTGYSESDSSGDKSENGQGVEDFWIVKTDSSGLKQWDKRNAGTRTNGCV